MPRIEVRRDGDTARVSRVGATLATVRLLEGDQLVGQAHVAVGNESTTISVSVDAADVGQRRERTEQLLAAALGAVSGDVHWWVHGATPDDDAIAHAVGLVPGRRLLQLRRPLPTGLPVDVSTRAFRPGVDEAAWVAVNNRAFAEHPEQGGWTVDTLLGREAEPWFDAAGFLLHERDGRLAAFCWTKLHDDPTDGRVGEIYVIGVDPDFQGLGLGKQLTLAGLESIAARGITIGMLYVDAANETAVAMYERLGFHLHRTDRAYTVALGKSPSS